MTKSTQSKATASQRGTLLPLKRFLEVVNWFADPNVARIDYKNATGDMVASYAFLGTVFFSRSKCSPSRLNTPRGAL